MNNRQENEREGRDKGFIHWMVHNRVAPNLLMFIFIIGGLLLSFQIKQEIYPAFERGQVTITVPYPGASPEEVEQGILLAIEESLSGIEAIDKIKAIAREGVARVVLYLRESADSRKAFQDIEAEINRITTFPKDAEEPVINLDILKWKVLHLHLYGQLPYHTLRTAAEEVKARLLQTRGINQVELVSPRAHEIEVAVPLANLRRYNLSHEQIAQAIRAASVELPGGSLNGKQGEILLRLTDRSRTAAEFAAIPVINGKSGATVSLGEVAEVRESFEDITRFTSFNGEPSIEIVVYRTGRETPVSVADKTKKTMAAISGDLPSGLHWAISGDSSEMYRARLSLLLKNAFMGLILVLVVLGLFLEIRLAFWVTMGIPVSFLGAMLFLPFFDVSINMVSMFAFIIALGIVVDDAIIAGENIYEHRQRGMNALDAAILGAREVAVPITFSILTNVTAFLPLAFVPGIVGKMWGVIPIVVITVFAISWFESLFILPVHLGHLQAEKRGVLSFLTKNIRRKVSNGLYQFLHRCYLPLLQFILSFRYLFILLMVAILLVTLIYVKSGRIPVTPIPRVESDNTVVTATLPWGSSNSRLYEVQKQLLASLKKVAAEYGDKELIANTSTSIDGNVVRIRAELTPLGVRPISTSEATRLWRELTAPIQDLQSLLFEADQGGPGGGAAISIELSHRSIATLNAASTILAEKLAEFPKVKDIDQGHAKGKRQYSYKINDKGKALGLNSAIIGQQIRGNWQGVVALRQQQGENEVAVRVRLPKEERSDENSLEEMLIRTPGKQWVPLSEVTDVSKAAAYTSITRRDRRRTVTVEANVEPLSEAQIILSSLEKEILPKLIQQFPGLQWSFQGRQADGRESTASLALGFLFALGGIYILLAIPFRSYSQPLIVMTAIPFGIVGAIYGHMLLEYNLSLMSIMGMIALSGVVVNDSLILVHYANEKKSVGVEVREAVILAGLRRFRPVLLTTVTTFCGLAPMIFETSRQARFMIPMAISLGFGIVFATVITLMLIPSFYLSIHDIYALFGKEKKGAIKQDSKSERIEELVRDINSKKS